MDHDPNESASGGPRKQANVRNKQKETSEDRKRLRNRLSQQAFRRRQAAYIKELREKANSNDKPQCEIIDALRLENTQLRDQLLDVQTKIARLLTTMQELSSSVASVAQSTSTQDESKSLPSTDGDSGESPWHTLAEEVNALDIPDSDACQVLVTESEPPTCELISAISRTEDYMQMAEPCASEEQDSLVPLETSHSSGSDLTWQIPNIWTFNYQMGPQTYETALSKSQECNVLRGRLLPETNSPFSDHIDVLQQLLKNSISPVSGQTSHLCVLLYTRVLTALSLFNSMTRPDVMAWYAKTRFYHIVDLTAWKILPCAKTLSKVFQLYQPTKTQLLTPHPDVIDWIPFPTIRDRLIQLHASNPQIDQIFCDAVSSYVVEAWMSDIVANAPRIRAYIRVNDLVGNIPTTVKWSEVMTSASLPAQDAEALFSRPECSQAVFKALNMNRGAAYYKMDPAFFGKYPELYDHAADIAAQGVPLRPMIQTNLSSPKRLDETTFEIYRNFIDFSRDAPIEAS